MPNLAQLITLAMANQKNSAMTEKRSPEGPKLITNQIELFIASFAPTSIQMIFFQNESMLHSDIKPSMDHIQSIDEV